MREPGSAHGTCYHPPGMRLIEDDPKRTRTSVWMVAAALLHAGAMGALLFLPAPRRILAARTNDAVTTEIVVTIDEGAAVPSAEAPSDRESVAGAVAAVPRERMASRAAASGESGAAGGGAPATSAMPAGPAGPGEGPIGDPSGPPAGGGVAVPIPFSAAELGIGGNGPNAFAPRSAAAAEPSARPAVEQSLRAAMRESDRMRGFGPEGPVLRALSDATSLSLAPFRGRAVFDVHAGSDGEVSRVELIEGDGDNAGWMDARRIAVQELRGKKLKVPSGATAMVMRIEVVSEWKLPNGASASGAFGGRRGDDGTPELTIPDPSNIGAKPRRVVRTRSVSTQVL